MIIYLRYNNFSNSVRTQPARAQCGCVGVRVCVCGWVGGWVPGCLDVLACVRARACVMSIRGYRLYNIPLKKQNVK